MGIVGLAEVNVNAASNMRQKPNIYTATIPENFQDAVLSKARATAHDRQTRTIFDNSITSPADK